MVAKESLPHKLQVLLAHPRVLKVSRLVNADLARLQSSCHLSQFNVTGGMDLTKFAKDCGVIRSASRISLSDLCATILHRRLNKNTAVRINKQWENTTLRPDQLQYAAADACAALLIYENLVQLKVPIPMSATDVLLPHSPVLIYSMDNMTVIAEAQISQSTYLKPFDDI